MNPLKTLFNKIFESTPPVGATDETKQDSAFEWNPDAETVAPTSASATSWKRGDAVGETPAQAQGEATHTEIAEAAHTLPTPVFEKAVPAAPMGATTSGSTQGALMPEPPPRPFWNEPVDSAPLSAAAPFVSVKAAADAGSRADAGPRAAAPASLQNWVKPNVPDQPLAVVPLAAQSLIPLSDFEDIYRKAGIKSPVHGYGVERVYRLLTSRRLVGLDRSVRRAALLTALDAAGVPASDVSQDAVLRGKALTAYEAEKALELQSLRSRNESRAEALQDTVATFTRQKQTQIERLAQGSTAAVRAQSDLEIRKRMEQDRLYRSLAYFVEPLPSVAEQARPAFPEASKAVERFDATIEMRPAAPQEVPVGVSETETETATETSAPEAPPPSGGEPAVEALTPEAPTGASDEPPPVAESGLETALKAAAEEARLAGWGKAKIVEDSASDPVEALRKLREPPKTESES